MKLEEFKFDEEDKLEKRGQSEHTHVEPSIKDFLKHKLIRCNLIVFIILFATTQFNSYIVGFNMKYIQGNFYANRIVRVFAYILANLIAPKVLKKFDVKLGWAISLTIVIIFSLPLNFIDASNEEEQIYILIFIFLTSIGLGMCGNLLLNTIAALFPSMFETEAFATGNIIA